MATFQGGWQWCSLCSGLVHDSRAGVCPVSTEHARVGAMQVAMSTSEADGVPGWSWCGRCSQMFWRAGEAASRCPGGGTHTSGESGPYALPRVTANRTPSGWYRCGRCQSLFSGYEGTGGSCFDGAAHNAADDVQYLPRQEILKLMILRGPKIKRV